MSDDPAAIARFVGTRTVYSYRHIQEMASKPVLAILFRQSRVLNPAVSLDELRNQEVIRGPPQSIVATLEKGRAYLAQLLM